MATITFHELSPARWFSQRTLVKKLLLELFKREGTKLDSLQIILCSDDYLLEMNQQFLDHDTYTDIITFDLTEGGAPGTPKTGEIYISVERVQENAAKFDLPRGEELRRVIFHGCLHLCGYKDKLKKDQVQMRAKEEEYLSLYQKRST